MADKNVKVAANTGNAEVDEVLDKARDFWERFSKPIIYVSTALILIFGGWWAYNNFYKIPRQEKANEMIFPAERLFDKMAQDGSYNKDSVNIVLNGDANKGITGLTKVISSYGSTPAGSRAKIKAARCYLFNKDFNNALKYLKDVPSLKSTQVQSTVYSMMGDAYGELKQFDQAYDYYQKAAGVNDKDDFESSQALLKAGKTAEQLGKTDDAINIYKKIRDNYPTSTAAAEMDKDLARLGVVK